MRRTQASRLPWIAFLLMCFALTGLVGLFASYAAAIPLERALVRIEALDAAPAASAPAASAPAASTPAAAAAARSGRDARASVIAEARAEAGSIGLRTRLLILLITVSSGAVGTFMLLLACRQEHAGADVR